MSLIRCPLFFQLGRLQVFAEGWKRVAGESLIQTEKISRGGFTTFQLWMPGVHLIVDLAGKPEVVAGG